MGTFAEASVDIGLSYARGFGERRQKKDLGFFSESKLMEGKWVEEINLGNERFF